MGSEPERLLHNICVLPGLPPLPRLCLLVPYETELQPWPSDLGTLSRAHLLFFILNFPVGRLRSPGTILGQTYHAVYSNFCFSLLSVVLLLRGDYPGGCRWGVLTSRVWGSDVCLLCNASFSSCCWNSLGLGVSPRKVLWTVLGSRNKMLFLVKPLKIWDLLIIATGVTLTCCSSSASWQAD